MNLPRFVLTITFASLLATACSKNTDEETITTTPVDTSVTFFIKAADASFIPEIRLSGATTFNAAGDPEDMLTTLKNSGVNTIRLRLWYSSANGHSGFNEVKAFSDEIKSKGMKVWLSVHYSDTWADPEKQVKPEAWNQLSYVTLKDSVNAYTRRIARAIQPDYIQIGNEINNGILWPEGSSQNPEQMKALIETGISAVRAVSAKSKIMIHIAGIDDAEWLLNEYNITGYDMVALSYYPVWHGKSLLNLEKVIYDIGRKFNKKVVIAETAYPFTLLWNDYTNNIIGSNNQILS
ncbi:MAG: arabinogalactan endo-1,4-beta-galactosidase, partial [Bacteroidetes bacterium HGW-Bacteroidetes-22]